jgi:hypothetical protein
MLRNLPEHRRLEAKLLRCASKLCIRLRYIDPELVAAQPYREEYLDNPAGLFAPELNALHQAIWDREHPLQMEVDCLLGFVPPVEGPSCLEIRYSRG